MKKLTVKENLSIKKSLKAMNQSGNKCLIVVGKKNLFLGTLSGGDLRRAIMNGVKLGSSIKSFYNKNPVFFKENNFTLFQVKQAFTKDKFDLIPIINEKKQLVDIISWNNFFKSKQLKKNNKINIPVVIMAGGKGLRMSPFTKILPKPLIPIKEKPVIDHIIESFLSYGFKKFFISLNHKSEILKAYFKDKSINSLIQFVEEEKPLGTAGCLSMLKNKINEPFFISNCDTLVEIDYKNLAEFHIKNKFEMTLVTVEKEFQIPFGACILNDDYTLKKLTEKPSTKYQINVGLYFASPSILSVIPSGKAFDMTDVINKLKQNNKKIGIYKVDQKCWHDVGRWDNYNEALIKF